MEFIPYGKQDINQEDIDSVIEVLKSDFLTQGPKVPLFEDRIKDYAGAKHCSAFNSATSALHCACLALGVQKGDIVWTTPISFVATSNSALYCGATVEFIDIDPETFNICTVSLEKSLLKAKESNTLPKVVIPVHMCGQSCNMEEIGRLAKEYNFKVVEDASHAVGGEYKSKKVGSCQFSDITIFSFHPVKIITTAEGGAACTNSDELKKLLDLYRSHGVTKNKKDFIGESHGDWYYQQLDLGYNYRMTELQAALGASQIERLDEFVNKRNDLAKLYNEELKDLPLTLPKIEVDTKSSFHLYIIKLDDANKREILFKHLRESNIGVNVHYIPIHTQPYYVNTQNKDPESCPNSLDTYTRIITLPLHPNLTHGQIIYIKEKISEVI